MKNNHIEYILYLVQLCGGTHLVDSHRNLDYKIKDYKGKLAVYQFNKDTNDWDIRLTKKRIINEYIPFVFLATYSITFRK